MLVVELKKDIVGVKVSRKAPPITHLLFADDILIFGQANMQHVNNILQIIKEFGNLPGQMLNFEKSCVYFSNNLSPYTCDTLANALNMSLVVDSEKYLGAPLLLGHSKLNFWRGHKTGKGIKFIAWDNINKSKDLGGIGFRDLETFNISLICKLVWKIISDNDELWIQILRAKCGTRINIWMDNWVIGLGHPPVSADGLVNTVSYTYGSDIFHEGTRNWKESPIHYLFEPISASKILDMNVPVIGNDTLIWFLDRKGLFSVKSVYNVMTRQSEVVTGTYVIPQQVWKTLWKIKLPHKVKLFVWKCIQDIVPTRDKLSRYKCGIETHSWFFYRVISWFHTRANLNFGTEISTESLNKLLMVFVWSIWKDRCSKKFQNHDPNRVMTLDNINKMVYYVPSHAVNLNTQLQIHKWKPPDFGYLKINIDASFFKESLQGGTRLIIRNFAGHCHGVQGQYFNVGMMQGIEVELECKALTASVSLAVTRSLTHVVFEYDNEVLIKSINEQVPCVHWMNQGLVLNIKFLLNKIRHWKCNSVRRTSNTVADKIAKKARSTKLSFEFFNEYPSGIQGWITQDYDVSSI
ncbi:uncharacterized protein LOC113295145 [Papaver somniferum]|uniref:uncharacterized protein LOC113295145 n=1 Tax=Papaver somniferum TaxID=3469 RepID=UPI000E7060F4|nr:uncharacterized protein LOC113295145 [Papaver somniferum]